MKNNNLHKIKSAGFKTPKGYFEAFEETLVNKLKTEFKLEDVKATGFNVPENYFKTLDETILNNINNNETKVVQLNAWKKVAYISAVAASLVLMFNIFKASDSLTFETLETATIENYLLDEDYINYELASLLTEDDLNSEIFANTSISETLLEDYLLDNTTIEDLLIE